LKVSKPMKSLTICMATARHQPHLDWFLDSLDSQINHDDEIHVIIVSSDFVPSSRVHDENLKSFSLVEPKPNVWQGTNRITKDNWWAKSSALNTAICLCKTDWICFLDDRCVLSTTWLQSVRKAMTGNYIMAGAYEKRTGMRVEKGIIKYEGMVTGKDRRESISAGRVRLCGGDWLYGCCLAIPLEWALQVNGLPERCDSVGFEDVIFGLILQNNKFPMRYDPRAKLIEDRSPDQIGGPMKRTSKKRFRRDDQNKANTTLQWANSSMRSDNDFEIRELRDRVLRGEPFPPVDANREYRDWFDGQLVREF
jgi:Glycosyl transferase family 2